LYDVTFVFIVSYIDSYFTCILIRHFI